MVFLFVCPELIGELGGARNVKFGAQVNHNESTIKFEDLSEIFTPRRDRRQIVLTNEVKISLRSSNIIVNSSFDTYMPIFVSL